MKEKIKEYKAWFIMGGILLVMIAGDVVIYKKIYDIVIG